MVYVFVPQNATCSGAARSSVGPQMSISYTITREPSPFGRFTICGTSGRPLYIAERVPWRSTLRFMRPGATVPEFEMRRKGVFSTSRLLVETPTEYTFAGFRPKNPVMTEWYVIDSLELPIATLGKPTTVPQEDPTGTFWERLKQMAQFSTVRELRANDLLAARLIRTGSGKSLRVEPATSSPRYLTERTLVALGVLVLIFSAQNNKG